MTTPMPVYRQGSREYLQLIRALSAKPRGLIFVRGSTSAERTELATAITDSLRRPLQRIDLTRVRSRYIGETEKNLARVFGAAESTDVILFFDEADALFGNRTAPYTYRRYVRQIGTYLAERIERHLTLCIVALGRSCELPPLLARHQLGIVEPAFPDEPGIRTAGPRA